MRAYDVRPPSLPCPPSPRCVEKVFNMTRRGCTLLVVLCGDGGASLRCLHVIAGASREVCDVARRENPPRHVVSPVSKSRLVSINSNEKKRIPTLYALLVHSHALLQPSHFGRVGVFLTPSWSWFAMLPVAAEVA